MNGIIYIIRNSFNKKVYVGQTWQQLNERCRSISSYKGCTKLFRAMKKYGFDNFTVEQICKCEDQQALDIWEDYFIETYDSIKNGYNIRKGGSRGKLNDETKAKLSKALIGNTNSKDRVFTESHKNRISNALRGKKLSDEHRKSLSVSHKVITLEQEISICNDYKKSKSSLKTGKKFNISDRTVCAILKRHNIHVGKFTKEQEKDICQNFIEINSLTKVGQQFECSSSAVARILKRNGHDIQKLKEQFEINAYNMYLKSSILETVKNTGLSEWKVREIIKKNKTSNKRGPRPQKVRDKISAGHKGKKLSKETKEKISKANKRFSPEEEELVFKKYMEIKSFVKVSKLFKCSSKTVMNIVNRHKLKENKNE